MFPCPGCGAALKFNVEAQKLKCDYCGSLTDVGKSDPETVATENSEEEKAFFETTVFYCPQCGGEMMGDDTDATAFCSYCGAVNVLETRLVKEKRPAKIIPFKITKAQCVDTFTNAMKKNFFVPKELKKDGIVDSFRGIYTPYYSYRINQQKHIKFTSEKSTRSGDYINVSTFNHEADLDQIYDDITHDASTSFYDDISEALEPFDKKDMKAFEPEYLAGFYADIPDVSTELYREDMTDLANSTTMAQLQKQCKGATIKGINEKNLSSEFGTRVESVETRMYPAWFMSYRYKDKIAYATVNGQTGKLVTDYPIDTKKVIMLSLLIAVGLFAVLNLFFTFKPVMTLSITSIMSLVSLWIMRYEAQRIHVKQDFAEDKAMQKMMYGKVDEKAKGLKKLKVKANILWPPFISILFIWIGLFSAASGGAGVIAFLGTIISAIVCIIGTVKARDFLAMTLTIIISAFNFLASFVILSNTPRDGAHYFFAMVQLILMIISVIHIVRGLNKMSLRPLPQFKKKGGDDGLKAVVLLVGAAAASLLAFGRPAQAAYGYEPDYINPDTGYEVLIYDDAGLLFSDEEASLVNDMIPITEYASVLFYTTYEDPWGDAEKMADIISYEIFGDTPGTAFFIDMDTRNLCVWSQNGIEKIITNSYGDTITDNVYRYATKGDYYECASRAFDQMYSVLDGQRIRKPMKYISNALIALVGGFLITFIIVVSKTRTKKVPVPSAAAIVVGTAAVAGLTSALINTKRVYSPRSSSGGGSHGGGGHGGGGHHGGGGSHGF